MLGHTRSPSKVWTGGQPPIIDLPWVQSTIICETGGHLVTHGFLEELADTMMCQAVQQPEAQRLDIFGPKSQGALETRAARVS